MRALDTELCRERVGELDLEADEARGLLRIGKLERRAALRVGAPDQHAALADLRERVRAAPARDQTRPRRSDPPASSSVARSVDRTFWRTAAREDCS
jgi:hypothetical protein